jgi:hypothetical protein
MRGYRFVSLVAGVVVVGATCVLALVVTGRTRSSKPASTASSASCAKTLLRDWSDGRIDGTYPIACYRAALASMPADLRVYSSAPEDISEALSARIVQSARQRSAGTKVRRAAG